MTLVSLISLLRSAIGPGASPLRLVVQEIRASFYRKLFLAFVAATLIPVLALALLVRASVASQLLADAEAGAARTALTAKRVIEESLALQQRELAGATVGGLSDDVMVWISRIIDQDVNIFDTSELRVTSERDLFASGLLPTRTPAQVHRAVAIDRLPTYVGQDRIGDFAYLVAAAPVRIGGDDAILTVPLALRQREIEREIADLDRAVLLGALLLILLGAGLGYWMAERIGDPVQRLTRATRRIAAGDLSTRVIVRTADELQRLVEAFNRMAGELQRQRSQVERTHRLEAWAEMARQVAHDIKNPLTPIQLSAEHLRRVHQDRGQPLVAGARHLRRHDPHPGPAAAADRLGVLQLRLVADRAADGDVGGRPAARGRRSLRARRPRSGDDHARRPRRSAAADGRSHAAGARRHQHPRERACTPCRAAAR